MKLLPSNKKGAYGIEVITSVIMGLFMMVLLVIAVFVGIATLNNSNILTTGSLEKNGTTALMNNLTNGVTSLGANFGTFFTILAVVIIMTFLGLMIYVIRRFAGSNGEKALG